MDATGQTVVGQVGRRVGRPRARARRRRPGGRSMNCARHRAAERVTADRPALDLGVVGDDRRGGIDAEDGEVERHRDDRRRGSPARRWPGPPARTRPAAPCRPGRGSARSSACGRGRRVRRAGRRTLLEVARSASKRGGRRLGQERLRLGVPQEPDDADARGRRQRQADAPRMRTGITPTVRRRASTADVGVEAVSLGGSARPASAATSAPHSWVWPAGGSGGPS